MNIQSVLSIDLSETDIQRVILTSVLEELKKKGYISSTAIADHTVSLTWEDGNSAKVVVDSAPSVAKTTKPVKKKTVEPVNDDAASFNLPDEPLKKGKPNEAKKEVKASEKPKSSKKDDAPPFTPAVTKTPDLQSETFKADAAKLATNGSVDPDTVKQVDQLKEALNAPTDNFKATPPAFNPTK